VKPTGGDLETVKLSCFLETTKRNGVRSRDDTPWRRRDHTSRIERNVVIVGIRHIAIGTPTAPNARFAQLERAS